MKYLMELDNDSNANSPTFFMKKSHSSYICKELVEELEAFCLENRRVVRVCMHSSPEDDLHNMLIAHPKGLYVRPHANLTKSKAYHLVKGEIFVALLNEKGEVFHRLLLSASENQIFRLERGAFLFLWPISEVAVFHEIAIGPFLREKDTVFADFSPKPDDYIDSFVRNTIGNFCF